MREFMDEPELSETEGEPPACACRYLRTKTGFGASVGYTPWRTGESSTAAYWCLQTMKSCGPDEALVHPQKCCAGRSCYRSEAE